MNWRAWIGPALAMSLAANVFVVGLWLGGRTGGQRMIVTDHGLIQEQADAAALIGDLRPRQVFAALPPTERRQAMRLLLREARAARPVFAEARAARRAAAEAIAAEPFDAEAAAAALARARASDAAARERSHAVLVTLLSRLPEDVRREVVSRAARSGPPHLGDRPGRPRPPPE